MSPFAKVVLKNLAPAFGEFKFIIILSLMPLWLGALLQTIVKASAFTYLNGYLANGEALLICTSTIGPLLYIILKDDENLSKTNKPFPGKSNYILFIILVCAISAAILGLKTAIKDTSSAIISFDAIWLLSLAISVASLVLWFLVAATKLARETGAPALMRAGDVAFTKEFQAASDE